MTVTFAPSAKSDFATYRLAALDYLGRNFPLPGDRTWDLTSVYNSPAPGWNTTISVIRGALTPKWQNQAVLPMIQTGGDTEIAGVDNAINFLNPQEIIDWCAAQDAGFAQRAADAAKAFQEQYLRDMEIAKQTADKLAQERIAQEQAAAQAAELARQKQEEELRQLYEAQQAQALLEQQQAREAEKARDEESAPPTTIEPVNPEKAPLETPVNDTTPNPTFPPEAFEKSAEPILIDTREKGDGGVTMPTVTLPEYAFDKPQPAPTESLQAQKEDEVNTPTDLISTPMLGLTVIAFLIGLIFFWKN